MKRFWGQKNNWPGLAVLIFILGGAVSAQVSTSPMPLLQPITVVREDSFPIASPTPLVRRTGSSGPVEPILSAELSAAVNLVRSPFPIIAETPIPGRSGILVESLNGDIIVESSADTTFNPASNVKIATSYAVLTTFGPNYRFLTNVWTDGQFDASTGILEGNLYISGRDPIFGYEHAILIANELNRMGIRTVTGNLVVTENFVMNQNNSTARSARTLISTLDASKRTAAATRAWSNYLFYSNRPYQFIQIPNIGFSGDVMVEPMPTGAHLLLSHESAPIRDVVKGMMSYSNNFLAEQLGNMLGGPLAVARIVHQNTGMAPADFYLQTSSGLGKNRVTPIAMMKLLRVFRGELAKYGMTFADIMPVAGMDTGTLENRFDTDFSRGSVIGKTGTLAHTDGGVSALAGEINTRSGKLLFVIFNQRGSVSRFRAFQNYYVSLIQGQLGGAAAIDYSPISIEAKLAGNRISRPNETNLGNE